VKAAHAIAAEFRARIASGELGDGDPLPVENELVDRLGVSKGVVREALRVLEHEGLIEVRRGLGGGPRVRHPSIGHAANAMGVYLQIGNVAVMDVWAARDRIIGSAVERLAEARSSVPELGAATDVLTKRVGDLDAYNAALLDVNESAVREAGNATELMVVGALRHVVAAEIEAATRALVDVRPAVQFEELIARAWQDVVRHIRAGHRAAAARAFARQADPVRDALAGALGRTTVVDSARGRRVARR
jgi:GntR family transcriptional regulator, transcriptional repressor for pyruvate dehydrogenase complex